MSGGITALQRLARLRLENVLTEPLTNAISALTNLAYISLHASERRCNHDCAPLLPASASVLTGLQKLDIDLASTLPPALEALTGVHTVMRPCGATHKELPGVCFSFHVVACMHLHVKTSI